MRRKSAGNSMGSWLLRTGILHGEESREWNIEKVKSGMKEHQKIDARLYLR